MKNLFQTIGAEATRRTILILAALSLLASAPTVRATPYVVTNDLASTFQLFYWTNNAGTNVFSFSTNLPPGGTNRFNVSTNGVAGLGVMAINASAGVLANWTNLQGNSDFLSDVFAQAMALLQPPGETVPQTQLILNSYFIAGAIPTYAQYKEWQDTEFWYINAMYTNALAAAVSAAQVTQIPSNAPVSGCILPWGSPQTLNLVGCYTTNLGASPFSATIIFSNALPSTNYFVLIKTSFTNGIYHGSGTTPYVYSFTTTQLVLRNNDSWAAEVVLYPYSVWNQILLTNGLLSYPF